MPNLSPIDTRNANQSGTALGGDPAAKFFFALLVSFLSFFSEARANLIVNGSFELGNYTGNKWTDIAPGSADLTGWMNTGTGIINWHNDAEMMYPFDGTKVVDLNNSGGGLADTGILSQSFATDVGASYLLTFYFSGPTDTNTTFPDPRQVQVDIAGIQQVFSQAASPNTALVWGKETLTFIATDPTTTLMFTSVDGSGYWGPLLDMVSVEAVVPEPSSLVILVCGAAVTLGFGRRRIKKVVGPWAKAFLGWMVLFCVFSGFKGGSAFAVTLDDLQKGMSDRESALQSFAVTVNYRIQRHGNAPEKYETLDAKDLCTFDGGRIRCEGIADIPGNMSVSRSTLGVFNEKEMRLLEGETTKGGPDKTQWVHGRVAKQPDVFSWQTDPRDLFLREHGRSFGSLLRDSQARIDEAKIVGVSTWEGRSVVELERGPFVNGKQITKGLYLIDPTRGFAVVRQASFIQFPPDTKWIEYSKTETFDYVEVKTGVWVPRRAFKEFSEVREECVTKGVAPELYWRGEIHFDGWRLHPATSDDLFTLRFPGGISIDDKIVGKSYISANVQDQSLCRPNSCAQ